MRKLGWSVDVLDLGEGFPYPSAATLEAATQRLLALGDTSTIIDGLAFGILADAARNMRAKPIALVHHPLALETGVSPEYGAIFAASEREALTVCRAVIVTSPATARSLVETYGVSKESIAVAEPGVDRRPVARRVDKAEIALLSVGAVSPRKGYDVLVRALAKLRTLPWRLTIAGTLDRNPECAADLRKLISERSLNDRIALTGSVSHDALNALYDSADVFVLASHYEGYGMVITEAIAAGLPIVATTGGAIPDTVPSGTGILVPPGNDVALADALRKLIEDRELRLTMSRNAEAAAEHLPTWEGCAVRIANVLERLS
nr:glycosyltransferase family 4 protein [Variibacter gotjawalensis]